MNSDLLQRIESFDLDDLGSDFKFSDRLARENSWSNEFAVRCINEYKKFLFLCAEAGHPVTPSVAVDHAWHLHLCYTRSYWHDLCQDTLGFPLHHGPTKGGAKENEKFNDWYQKTLASYKRLFKADPPEDIWPTPKVRFSPQDIKNVDLKKHFVISKKSALQLGVSFALSFSLLGCVSVFGRDDGLSMVIFLSTCFLVIFLAIKFGGGRGKGGGGCGGGSSCGSNHGCSSGCGGGGCGGGCGGS